MTLLTREDEAWFLRAAQEGKEAWSEWEAHGEELTRRYGGQWIAMKGRHVVAHDPDPQRLRKVLDTMGPDAEFFVIRFVPPATWDFAF